LTILILLTQVQWFLFAVERTFDVHDFGEGLSHFSLLYQLHHPQPLSDLETVSLLFPHEVELHVQFLPLSYVLLAPLFVLHPFIYPFLKFGEFLLQNLGKKVVHLIG
jgi:hypothetical protein